MKFYHRIAILLALLTGGLSASVIGNAQDNPAAGSTPAAQPAAAPAAPTGPSTAPVPSGTPNVHVVRQGDTLWDISGRYYRDPYRWPQVWSYNPEITNPHWIYPDDRVRLRDGVSTQGGGATGASPSARPEALTTVRLTDTGYLDSEALDQVGTIVGAPEEQMMLATFDRIYVQFESQEHIRDGAEFVIFQENDEDLRLDEHEGAVVRIRGLARIEAWDPETQIARAAITEALDPVERGFRLAPLDSQFAMARHTPATQDVDATVIAALRTRELLATRQIVFVDAGESDGVRLGNKFVVVRRTDAWRAGIPATAGEAGNEVRQVEHLEGYPPEVVAEGRVVSVRPGTSAVVITRAVDPVAFGDQLQMRRGR